MVSNTKQPKIMNNIRQQIRRQLGDKTINLIINQGIRQTSNKVLLQAEGEVFQQVSGQLYQSFEPNVKMTMLNHNYSLFLEKLIDYGD
jgi:hypothetical protein